MDLSTNPVVQVVFANNINKTYLIYKDHSITEIDFIMDKNKLNYQLGGISKSFSNLIKPSGKEYVQAFYHQKAKAVIIISDNKVIYFWAFKRFSDPDFDFNVMNDF